MLKKILLATAATALIAAPAAARDHRWDNHGYHRDNSGALVGALLGAVAGAAIVGSIDRSDHGYQDPAYSYGNSYSSYGYPSYGYAQPSYGYAQPSYGYAQPSYGYSQPAYGYGYPSDRVTYNRGYRGW